MMHPHLRLPLPRPVPPSCRLRLRGLGAQHTPSACAAPPPQTLAQALSANIFAVSIIPYAAFLYYLTKSKAAPPLMLFGWYFLLAFVGVSIPAGIYGEQGARTPTLQTLNAWSFLGRRAGRLTPRSGPSTRHTPPFRPPARTQPRCTTARRWPTWTGCTGARRCC